MDRVCDEQYRLHGGVKSKAVLRTLSTKIIRAWVVPDIGSIASEPPELDIVLVRLLAVLENENQLMPRAIKRAHAAVALRPNTQVHQFAFGGLGGRQYLLRMSPIHKSIDEGAFHC